MILSRRDILLASGCGFLALKFPAFAAQGREVVIEMRGTARGERVWFDPIGVAVSPGTTLKFINLDAVNSHTVTAYHPEFFDRVRRIPEHAEPFNSGYLLPERSFELTLRVPGVYDYYCLPHEMAAMVGRIVVGQPGDEGWDDTAVRAGGVMDKVEGAFPSVEELLASTEINRGQK